jgi:aprataxin
MSFNRSLFCQVAKHKDPESIPAHVYFTHTEHTITIFDAYPKADYHLLMIPRVSNDPEERVWTARNLMSLKTLFSANGLEKKDVYGFLLRLKTDVDALREELEEDMRIRRGFTWKLNFGFHAVQSME